MSDFTQETSRAIEDWERESDCGYEILKQQLSAEHLLFIRGALDKELQDEHDSLLWNCTCEEDTAPNQWFKDLLLSVLFGKRR